MLDAADLIAKLAGPNTTLIPGHGTLIKKQDLATLGDTQQSKDRFITEAYDEAQVVEPCYGFAAARSLAAVEHCSTTVK
jgi:hypothetical protein